MAEPAADGLEQAMRYSLLAGGKRIRPVLALATADGDRPRPRRGAPAGGGDRADPHVLARSTTTCRRWTTTTCAAAGPRCHVAFGEDVAILAGDGLYAEAFRLLLTEPAGGPANVLAAARELAGATGVQGMVGGQYIDVAGTAPDGPAGLRRLHELKTGRLIAASIECVLLLAGHR